MKSEAFHFAKSFEHSPNASKQLNYICVNDFNVNNRHFNVKYLIPKASKPLNHTVFNDFNGRQLTFQCQKS